MVGLVLGALGLFGLGATMAGALLALQALFLLYFLRHLGFAVAASMTATRDEHAPPVDDFGGDAPTVSVVAACKNEALVAGGLVASLANLEYPAGRVEFILVDDGSTDRTADLLERHVGADHRFRVVRRPEGAGGGKSGALNDALGVAGGEIIVVFDADHQPRPDVLVRLVRHFADPEVAAVQGRCEVTNGHDALITRVLAIDYLAGYYVNEYGRQSLFSLPAYGGANCAVRADTLRAVGGWNPTTVTEDTDLTLRLLLDGHRVRYDVTAVDEEQGVTTLHRYWDQRYRWARGHQQACRDYLRPTWRSPHLSFAEKLETTMFLFSFHLPVLSAFGLIGLAVWFGGADVPFDPAGVFVLWTLLFLGPLLEVGTGLVLAGAPRREALVTPFFVMLFAVSVAVCTKAWVDAVLGRSYRWVKTPRSARQPVATS